jgi:hypothetical protein
MNRDKDLLSDKELFEKTTDIVEHATNARINLTFRRGENYCAYGGINPDNTKSYTINISTPPVKCIEKYTALLHELGHVLYQSPFTPIKKMLESSKYRQFYFSIFNVLEDQRIESHLSENYIAYKQRFEKTTAALGKNMGASKNISDPLFMLLAIRFNQEDIVRDAANFTHYKKALEDVKNTDKFGALRVFISIKKYVEEYLVLNSPDIVNQNNHLDKSELKDDCAPIPRTKNENCMIKSLAKINGSPSAEIDNGVFSSSYAQQAQKIMSEKSNSEEISIPQELLDASYNELQIDELLKEGKTQGQKQFLEIREKMLAPDIISDNLPDNVTKIERNKAKYAIDYKVSSNLNKFFKKLKMRNKPYVDYHGYDIDVEEYVHNLIRGIDVSKSFENSKKAHGSSIVVSIDGSRSMDGVQIKIAQKLVATIYESLKGIPKIEVKGNIWSGDVDGNIGITEINSMKDVQNITVNHRYQTTPTHMGLEYSGRMLKKMKGERKLLILITDGVPNHFKNGTNLQSAHYNKVCKKSLQKVLLITPNILCIVVREDNISEEFKKLFGAKRMIYVANMNKAFDTVVKQFKNFMRYNVMNFF